MTEPESEVLSPERLVYFTDAVAAIALTLLILPLLDLVVAPAEQHHDLGALYREHRDEFAAFALSFAVIFRFWWGHHRIFRHVAALKLWIVVLSAIWTFGIVLLPIQTAVLMTFDTSAATVISYDGTLVLCSAAMTLLAWLVYRHPELSAGRTRATRDEILGNFTILCAQILASLIGSVFLGINYWALALMLLTTPVELLIKRRRRQAQP